MEKIELRRPFFVVNPKLYLYGNNLMALADKADRLAYKYDFDVLFTAPFMELVSVISTCKHLIPCAQHMDAVSPGPGMGHILPESLADAGVKATFLNHAEHPCTAHDLQLSCTRARELGILTVVCADSIQDAKWIAHLQPDVMVCELSSLIGKGKAAGSEYMCASTQAVKSVSPHTKVLQAAGISTGDDVYNAIRYGADATGGTSGIVKAKDPFKTLEEMFFALDRARTDFCKGE